MYLTVPWQVINLVFQFNLEDKVIMSLMVLKIKACETLHMEIAINLFYISANVVIPPFLKYFFLSSFYLVI